MVRLTEATDDPLALLRGRTPPARLYHYTGGEGLKGILTSETIRATVVHFLNDAKEFMYAVRLMRAILQEREPNVVADLRPAYQQWRADLETVGGMMICVSSLSAERDLLSQWRGYCPPGAGFALGFRPASLDRALKQQDLLLAPCEYDESQQRAILERVLDLLESAVLELVADGSDPVKLARLTSPGLRFHMARTAPFIKHPAFSEEREWRIVSGLVPAEDLEFRMGSKTLIPYTSVMLTGGDVLLPLEEVVVGPTPYPQLNRAAAESLLEKRGLQTAAVTVSRVPFRTL